MTLYSHRLATLLFTVVLLLGRSATGAKLNQYNPLDPDNPYFPQRQYLPWAPPPCFTLPKPIPLGGRRLLEYKDSSRYSHIVALPTATPGETAPSATPRETVAPSATPRETVAPSATPRETVAPSTTPRETVAPSATLRETVAPSTTPRETASPTASPVQAAPPAEVQIENVSLDTAALLAAGEKYNLFALRYRQEAFEWQAISTKAIFGIVVVVVLVGLCLSWLHFSGTYSVLWRRPKAGEEDSAVAPASTGRDNPVATFKFGKEGIEITSSVIGLIIFAFSIVFLFLYLKFVYPMVEM
jgi:hypothetical protein